MKLVSLSKNKKNPEGLVKKVQIGEGGFGIVFEATLNHQKVVVKEFQVDQEEKSWKEFSKELKIMQKLKHKNIVELIAFYPGSMSLVMK